jgi:hypothetical protein
VTVTRAQLTDLERVLQDLDVAIAAAHAQIPTFWTHLRGERERVGAARLHVATLRAERDALEEELVEMRAVVAAMPAPQIEAGSHTRVVSRPKVA